jgi:hypothetical protein
VGSGGRGEHVTAHRDRSRSFRAALPPPDAGNYGL